MDLIITTAIFKRFYVNLFVDGTLIKNERNCACAYRTLHKPLDDLGNV